MDDYIAHYIVYTPDGHIRQSGDCPRSGLDLYTKLNDENYHVMEIAADEYSRTIDRDFYIRDGQLTPKIDLAIPSEFTVPADGVSEINFVLPSGTRVLHEGVVQEVEDDVFEFASEQLGIFHFFFQPSPLYKNFEVTIHAV